MNSYKRFSLFILIFLSFSITTNAQLKQTIRGQVLDMETKKPLPGATVQLKGLKKGVVTDGNGYFHFQEVPVGRVTLQSSYLGYEPQEVAELQLISSKELVVAIELKESLYTLNEVLVKARQRKDLPQNNMAAISARTFSVEEARRYAGAADDPARMAAVFAGVTTGIVESNAIIIRGNSPAGVLWRMEGVDIPVPSHFNGASSVPGGGMFTIFSSSMLANSDFYTGAFPAEFGNAVAGVFDMKFRNGNNRRHEFTAQAGVQGIELAAEGPFRKGYAGSFLFNVRISTLGFVQKVVTEIPDGQTIHYEDVAFKLNLPARKAGTFTLWGIGGNSITNRKADENIENWISVADYSDVRAMYRIGATGFSHKLSLGESLYLSSTLAATVSDSRQQFGIRTEQQPTISATDHDWEAKEYKLSLSSQLNHRHSAQWHSRYGIRLEQFIHRIDQQTKDDDDVMQVFARGRYNLALLQAFAQTKYTLNTRFSLIGGLHASVLALNGKTSIEPRISAEWAIADKHSLTFGSGLHSQIAPANIYFMELPAPNGGTTTPNRHLGMTRSWHNVLAYNWTIHPLLRLKTEAYFQHLYNVPVEQSGTFSMLNQTNRPSLFSAPFSSTGKGRNIGIDFTLERFFESGYYYMATLSLFDSQYSDASGNWHNTQFNTHYVINLLGGKEFTFHRKNGLTRVLGLNGRMALSTSAPYSALNEQATHLDQDIVYDDSQPFIRYKGGIEPITDVTVTYRVNYRKCSGTIAVQVKNLIGQQYLGEYYDRSTQTIEDLYFKSPIPFVSYKIEF